MTPPRHRTSEPLTGSVLRPARRPPRRPLDHRRPRRHRRSAPVRRPGRKAHPQGPPPVRPVARRPRARRRTSAHRADRRRKPGSVPQRPHRCGSDRSSPSAPGARLPPPARPTTRPLQRHRTSGLRGRRLMLQAHRPGRRTAAAQQPDRTAAAWQPDRTAAVSARHRPGLVPGLAPEPRRELGRGSPSEHPDPHGDDGGGGVRDRPCRSPPGAVPLVMPSAPAGPQRAHRRPRRARPPDRSRRPGPGNCRDPAVRAARWPPC